MKNKKFIKQQKLLNTHFVFLEKQLSWILKARPCGIALKELLPLIRHLHAVFSSRGLDFGLLYIKAVRNDYLNSLSGNPEKSGLVKLTKEGIPVCFGPLLKYFSVPAPREITSKTEVLQVLNTVLFSTRALKGNPEPNMQPIIGPSKRGTTYSGIAWMARDFWSYLGYRHQAVIPRALKFRRFHFTTKTGPNGHALGTWYYDLAALPEKLRESIKILGGERIHEFMSMALGLQSWTEELVWDGVYMLTGAVDTEDLSSSYIRRLTYFPDKEGKTRVIAILDYFSQTVLKGLHSYLFKLLKKIPQDMTFDQGAFVERIKSWPILYSIDLTAATDRFPIQLEAAVLRGHLPIDYVSAWEDVMVGYPFKMRRQHKEHLKGFDLSNIRYEVGNPMGAYSSWASFAVAHHYIFYYISRMLGKDWRSLNYVLLGDDILIGDEDVAKLYLEIIKDLGVDVSLAKTHVSKHTCEFAKRWFHRGHEISPFPISALKNCGKKYYFLTALLMKMEEKGWSWGSEGVSQVVSDFYGRVLNMPSRFREDMKLKSYTTEQIMKIIWGAKPADCMNNIARAFGHTEIYFDDRSALQLLSNIAVDLFSRSMPDVKKGKPLGLIAEELVIFITGKLEECPEAMTLLENPTLHAYGSIEQRYLDLLKMAREIDTERRGEWPLLLRAMTIPLSDDLFIDRQEQTEALGVSQIGRMLVDRIGIVKQYPSLMDIEQAMYPEPQPVVPAESPGMLDPLNSTVEEVEKLTGLKPAQQLDPSNFLNQEYTHQRSPHLSKPGSHLFKPAIDLPDRRSLVKEYVDWLMSTGIDEDDEPKSSGTPKGGPTGPGPKTKVSWNSEDRDRRMMLWLNRHGIDSKYLSSEFSKYLPLVSVPAMKHYPSSVSWSLAAKKRRAERRIIRKAGPIKGRLFIMWLKFVAWCLKRLL